MTEEIQNQNPAPTPIDEEIEKLKQQNDEYLSGWKRAQADYINYKKEEARRVQDLMRFANEGIVLELVDVIDNLDMAIKQAPESIKENKDWFQGITNVSKSFLDLLQKYGVEKVKTADESFDPLMHEAVQMEEAEGKESHIILEEFRAGYKMGDKIIRPARVKISK
jgi:molecular chaperone GrpE